MTETIELKKVSLGELSNKDLLEICGQNHSHLRIIEDELGVELTQVGNQVAISGNKGAVAEAAKTIIHLARLKGDKQTINQQTIYHRLRNMQGDASEQKKLVTIKTPLKVIRAKTENQSNYLQAINTNDVVFGVGPAGTGKTYLAVACAVEALASERVKRIILVRPVVEAGENLGFLPGDIGQKVDPYLRPLYDALYDFLGNEKVERLLENNVIELAPLAYMRGRTLSDAFVILDEAQNATESQMKMFLTRIGYGAKALVTGDPSQIDLPRGTSSGLRQSIAILDDLKGVAICRLTGKDIVRHPLVQRIVERYEKAEKTHS